jgi:type II secretory pathway component GspD/PulD (secretin)
LFRTGELSSRTVSFEVSSVGMKEFVFLVATAARWPVVVDQSIEGTLTLKLEDVRWDEAVRTVLKLGHITATRFGGVWFVSSEARLREIEARELPLVYRYRPQRTTLAAAAAALEPARSSGGAIAANHRLGIVVIVDRLERFPTYGRILTTIERGTAPLKLPTRVYHDLLQPASSGGEVGFPRSGLSLDFLDAEVEDVLLLYRDILGMNVVAQPGIKGRTTIFVTGLGVEEALDLMLRSTGLSYEVRDNILRVFPEAEGQAEVTVETVALAREDPEFFRPFTRCLTPAGALQIDSRSRTLIIRDVSGRAAWLRQLAEEIDRETGG